MRKVNIVIICFVVAFILLGIFYFISSNQKESNLNSQEQNDYVGEMITSIHKDFRAIIKSDWVEMEGSNLGYIFYTYLPPSEDKQSENAEFIFVSVGHIEEEINYTLEELLEAGIENSRTTMPDLTLTNNVEKEGKYFEGKEIQFTGTSEGFMREFVQFFGLKYGNIYTITYSCPLDNCNYYSTYNVFVESFEPIGSNDS